jgi:hypothetical protein
MPERPPRVLHGAIIGVFRTRMPRNRYALTAVLAILPSSGSHRPPGSAT